ncbi:MAG: 3-hydroxyacyl-CoA dehydrogenase NAD-binding domain-containing protein [Pseudomonadota bacterium]
MTTSVSLKHFDEVAVITVDHPPVNALSHAVRAGVYEYLDTVAVNPAVKAVVLECAGRTFFAGADIREFGQPPKAPSLRELLARMDAFDKLLVASIHGTALGGGLETALCCHYRIAARSARLGLPESKLGLLPGAGGTQRLPRLVGAETALDMIITGKQVGAGDAMDLGLVDRTVEPRSLAKDAVSFARELLEAGAPLRRMSEADTSPVDDGFFDAYRERIARKTRGFEAPERIIRCVEAAVSLPFEEGLALERDHFEACMNSTQSAAQRHLFFAERASGKVADVDRSTPVTPVESVGVVGAGTMGAGIALAALNARLPVMLLDSSADALQGGVDTIKRLLDDQVRKGRLTVEERDARLARLITSANFEALDDVDLVIEAVFETMAIKHEVFKALDDVVKPGAIIASNTSTLDLDHIASVTKRPQDVIGLHFFSPAHIMRLLEIVRGENTDPSVIARALSFARRIDKVSVVSGNCFGFIGNRMLYGYGRENQFLLLEGAAPEQIDRALTDFGMAMGPNAVGDLAGLDVGFRVRQERTDLPDDPRYYRVADMLAGDGRFGQKTGAGIFRYEADSRKPLPDPEVTAIIKAEAERLGVRQRDIADEEIVDRCILALVVEGARILEEGIAARSGDIDVVWANGYGFPRYRGGPMFYADTLGAAEVLRRVNAFAQSQPGNYWEAPALLKQLAETGGRFSDYAGDNA